MNARVKIVIGVAVALLALVVLVMLSQEEPQELLEERTELRSSTSATENSEANETVDREDVENEREDSDQPSRLTSQGGATFQAFKRDEFREAKGERVLFFRDSKDEVSEKTEKAIKENLKVFPKSTTFFAVDFNKEKEIVTEFNVQRAGTLLLFDEDQTMRGIYFSSEPHAKDMKTTLGMEE